MAISDGGNLGSVNQPKSSSTSMTFQTLIDADVGDAILIETAWDNTDTADGDTTRLSVTDESGNTYVRVKERTEADVLPEDGVTVAQFVAEVENALPAGSDIIVSSNTARIAKAAVARLYTKAAGTELAWETPATDQAASGQPGAVALSGLPSRDYLFVNTCGFEAPVTFAADAAYSAGRTTSTIGGASATNIGVGGAHKLATATGDTADPSLSSGAQYAQILTAFYEQSSGQTAAVGQAAETDAAAPTDVEPLRRLAGQATETDAAATITASQSRIAGQVAETDAAAAATPSGDGGEEPEPEPAPTPSTVTGARGRVSGRLGCGEYEAHLLTRGGGEIVVGSLPWTSLEWSRVLDDTSDGKISAASDPDCCDDLAQARPWRHELAIFRDGSLVWVGPVIVPKGAGKFDLDARGLTAWWDHRLIHDDHDFSTEVDLSVIFQAIADDAMAPDTSPGLTVTATPTGVLGTKQILASQHLLAGPVLRDLSKIGVDWTEVGRQVVVGGAAVPANRLGTFLDEHFEDPPSVKIDGSSQANAWLVKGSGGGAAGDSVYAYASDPARRADDGLLESVASISTIENFDAALAAAESRVALTAEVVAVEQCVLSPDAPYQVEDLIPGALCDLALEDTCIPVFGTYRLQKVAGKAEGGDETITLTFQPVGTEEEA